MDFSYHRSLAPMMWAFVALATAEAAIVHLLLWLWFPKVALILTGLSVATVGWLVMTILSFRRLPVRLSEGHLLWGVGSLKRVDVARANIDGLVTGWTAETLKARSVLNCALIAYPNVVVRLKAPVMAGRRRSVDMLAHKLDDPASFAQALADG